MNTIEDFKNLDKTAVLQTAAKQVWQTWHVFAQTANKNFQIWDAINDGTIYSIPSLLSSFTIISFANLKKYTFTYWFAFPALHSDPVWKHTEGGSPPQLSGDETTALVDEVGTWRYSTDNREHGFFLAKRVRQPIQPRDDIDPQVAILGYKWVIGSLRSFESGFFDGIDSADQFISFVDPSTYPVLAECRRGVYPATSWLPWVSST